MGTDTKPATEKKSKSCKWLVHIGVALLIYTVVGFFVVPAIIKSRMLKRLPALTKRQVAIEQFKCNPYVLSLTIRGFSLKEPNGDVFSSFDEFYGNFQLWASLFKRAWVFDEISLKKPFAQVTYQADGNFNFANLLENSASPPKPAAAASSSGNPQSHGAFMLLRAEKPANAAVGKSSTAAPMAGNAAPPPSTAESEIADMKAQLMEKTVVTDDDLRDLMKQRAAVVQAYLLNSQKVTSERLFIIALKPLDAAFKGEERVNLNLD